MIILSTQQNMIHTMFSHLRRYTLVWLLLSLFGVVSALVIMSPALTNALLINTGLSPSDAMQTLDAREREYAKVKDVLTERAMLVRRAAGAARTPAPGRALELLRALSAGVPSARLTALSLEERDGAYRAILSGVSPERSGVVALHKVLLGRKGLRDVNSPVSNLTVGEGGVYTFTMSVTVTTDALQESQHE